jgi:drug/metabolite transporter (DMT)-like permease
VVGAVVCEALFTILAKARKGRVPPLAMTLAMSWFGLLLFLPLGVLELRQFDLRAVPIAAWAAILYYALFATSLSHFLWFKGVDGVSASTAAVFTGLLSVSAVIFSYALLGEAFRWAHVWGGAAVLAAIRLSSKDPHSATRLETPRDVSVTSPSKPASFDML